MYPKGDVDYNILYIVNINFKNKKYPKEEYYNEHNGVK